MVAQTKHHKIARRKKRQHPLPSRAGPTGHASPERRRKPGKGPRTLAGAPGTAEELVGDDEEPKPEDLAKEEAAAKVEDAGRGGYGWGGGH